MDDDQTSEELDAHFGEGGPVAASMGWLRLILEEGDLLAAWPLTDPRFRLVLAQAWIWSNQDHPAVRPHNRDELAAELASETPTHALWPAFEQVSLGEVRNAFGGFDMANLGAAGRPRPVSPGYEVVLIIPTREGFVWEPGTAVLQKRVLLHSTPEGWLVAGVGDDDPVPGWPPGRSPGRS